MRKNPRILDSIICSTNHFNEDILLKMTTTSNSSITIKFMVLHSYFSLFSLKMFSSNLIQMLKASRWVSLCIQEINASLNWFMRKIFCEMQFSLFFIFCDFDGKNFSTRSRLQHSSSVLHLTSTHSPEKKPITDQVTEKLRNLHKRFTFCKNLVNLKYSNIN